MKTNDLKRSHVLSVVIMAMLSIALISTHSPGIHATDESQSLSLGHELDAVSSAEADMTLGGYATVRNARLSPDEAMDSDSAYPASRYEMSPAETAPHASNNALEDKKETSESEGADDFAPQSTSVASSASDAARVYLEKTIPPCTLVTVPGKDPCETREYLGMRIWEFRPVPASGYEWLSYSEHLDDAMSHADTTHIALRGTALPNTTRCLHYVSPTLHKYSTNHQKHRDWKNEVIQCFMDVAVQEYISGRGAPTITLAVLVSLTSMGDQLASDFAQYLFGWNDVNTYDDFLIEQLEHRYAGSEHIFYIQPSEYLESLTWQVVTDFDVVRNGPAFTLPTWVKPYGECETDLCAHHRFMNTLYEYPEIISGTRRHHQALVGKYGGFISSEPGIARLALDTYDLENHFRAVGGFEYAGIAPPPPQTHIPVNASASYGLAVSLGDNSGTGRYKRSSTATGVGAQESISVTWNPVSGAVKYRVEGRAEGAYDWIVHRDDLTEPSHTAHGLKCGTQYHFRFRAFGEGDLPEGSKLAPHWTLPFGPVSATTAPCVRTP